MTVRIPPGERVYAIGDVHGLSGALDALLRLIDDDIAARPPATVTEVFVGDYVDRGPDSFGVVERLLAPPAEGRTRVCLRGNHDAALLASLYDTEVLAAWRSWGADATLRSYGLDEALDAPDPRVIQTQLAAALPPAHHAFLSALPLHHQVGDVFFVHAGIRPGVPLAAQAAEDLVWIRDEFLDHPGPHPAHVVHGHTPVAQPEHWPWRTNIDTGAVYGGALTAAVLEGDDVRFLSVPGERWRP